jgi:adenylyltransferase/sulfurtransferase
MEISATELKERLDRGDEIVILDIRKPYELSIASLENVLHIPEEEIACRLEELRSLSDKDLVVYCRTGRRSTELVAFLEQQGLKRVFNLTGGLHAWSDDVDPEVMKY